VAHRKKLSAGGIAALALVVALSAVATLGALNSCQTTAVDVSDTHATVLIKGEPFRLELALDDRTRVNGLGGRESIPEDGGMLFVFPRAARRAFVMRDCLVPIDIAYLDNAGRVVAIHEMQVEPRRPGESPMEYERRLTQYPSRYPARFAVEVAGGTLVPLGLETGDVVQMDLETLKARAR
jgi:hypothetical protein